jgi:hypothetical protein
MKPVLLPTGPALVFALLFAPFGFALFVPAPAQANPVTLAPPVTVPDVTFPFSVQVTTAFGPLDTLFGRSFQIGDTLTGRLTFDGTSGPDEDPWPAHGVYAVPSARLELDVPSGFALDAGNVDRFHADTFNDIPGTDDELIFYAFTCCHPTGIGFVNVDVYWTDATQRALTSDRLPSDPAVLGRFRRAGFGLLAGDDDRIALFGESPLEPVPEPATLLLFATGSTVVARKGWERRHRGWNAARFARFRRWGGIVAAPAPLVRPPSP